MKCSRPQQLKNKLAYVKVSVVSKIPWTEMSVWVRIPSEAPCLTFKSLFKHVFSLITYHTPI